MSAAIFRSNGKTIVNFMSICVSKPAFLLQSRVAQILTISDFWPVTIQYFKPGLWLGWAALGWAGQAARLDWAGLGWPGGRTTGLGGGQTKLGLGWPS